MECKWDWRSLKCEQACHCNFQFQKGDYHLGRSCRRRKVELEVCEQTVFVLDKAIPKRILSLVRQTTDILKAKIKRTTQNVWQKATHRYEAVQQNVCSDLTAMVNERQTAGAASCWPSPPILTLPERIFCRHMEFPACTGSSDSTHTTAAAGHKDDGQPRQGSHCRQSGRGGSKERAAKESIVCGFVRDGQFLKLETRHHDSFHVYLKKLFLRL